MRKRFTSSHSLGERRNAVVGAPSQWGDYEVDLMTRSNHYHERYTTASPRKLTGRGDESGTYFWAQLLLPR